VALNRRQFLKGSAIAVAAAGFSRVRVSDAAAAVVQRGPARKVLILGAGMAGLVSGHELTKLGHDVTILEARRRPLC
jgi:monoamine oxidase